MTKDVVTGPIDNADPLELERQVCFALSVAARGVVGIYRPLLEPMGLTHPQYLVMLALWQQAPLSVRELSRLLQLDPGTLSPFLKRLEAIGYVRRRRDPSDERSLAVTLTPSGQALRGWRRRRSAGCRRTPRHADRGTAGSAHCPDSGDRGGRPGQRLRYRR